MKLITKEIKTKIKANMMRPEEDRKPIFKLFTPWGAATWLISELIGDEMYGLCDLGMGSPEVGYVSLSELKAIRGPFNLSVERDVYWSSDNTLNWWADQARRTGGIAA